MTERVVVNTYDQLKAAREGVAISPRYIGIRETRVYGWRVWRLNGGGVEQFGQEFDVDMSLPFRDRQEKALNDAKQWAARVLGEAGPWSRNSMGDVIPTRLHKRFPLRKIAKKRT